MRNKGDGTKWNKESEVEERREQNGELRDVGNVD